MSLVNELITKKFSKERKNEKMSGTIIEPVTDISVFATEPKNYRCLLGKGCPNRAFP